jgi:hypothetical protein
MLARRCLEGAGRFADHAVLEPNGEGMCQGRRVAAAAPRHTRDQRVRDHDGPRPALVPAERQGTALAGRTRAPFTGASPPGQAAPVNAEIADGNGRVDPPRRRRSLRFVLAALAAVVLEAAATWLRSGRVGGNLIVRCRRGHLFSTIWLPAASVKSLRLGFWRVQRCPEGHWSIVTPVRVSTLSRRDRSRAVRLKDVRLP